MSSYILRAIDPDLWARVKARSQQEGVPLRAVILKLLELYGHGQIRLEAVRKEMTMAAYRIDVDGLTVITTPERADLAARIIHAADDEGTIQAWDMVSLFPGRPERHTTTSMDRALAYIGAEIDRDR